MIGKRLGQYEIVERIGAGGMGEVYRARDTKLERDVAIKLLPDEFARDSGRLDRFEREAKLLAALNHPNIAAIHGFEEIEGSHFLALELVAGTGLDERLAQGPLPAATAAGYACQIARALEAAHAKGIVHRDLKPANIKITPEGSVKVLDFGLAKALSFDASGSPAAPSADVTRSPTITEGTRTGVILGTAAYMSPEQARGNDVDRRSDIWSFGCVLFEMLTGKRPFAAHSTSDAIAAILKDDPDWSALPSEVSASTRRVLFRCLQKDPDRRLHDIADARIELEDAADESVPGGGVDGPAAAPSGSRPSRTIAWGSLALAGVASVIAALSWVREAPAPASVRRATITLPAGRTMQALTAFDYPFALAPDGNMVVYSGIDGGRRQLYARPLDAYEAQPIAGTEGGSSPFFSPDGGWIGFVADGWIKKIPVGGGVALPVCEVGSRLLGATWTSAGTIVFTPDIAGGLREVSAAGGEANVLTQPDRSNGEVGHNWPHAIPGTDIVLFTLQRSDRLDIGALLVGTRTWSTVLADAIQARYVASGHLVYLADGLRAVPFDLAAQRVTGDPAAIVAAAWFDVSSDGTLAYVAEGWLLGRRAGDLVWVDRSGEEAPVAGGEDVAGHPVLSPGGERVAVEVRNTAGMDLVDLYVLDLAAGGRTRLSLAGIINNFAVWSPDGGEIVFNSARQPMGLYRKRWDAPGEARLFHPRGSGGVRIPTSWSAEHGTIAFTEVDVDSGGNIWDIPSSGSGEPRPLVVGPHREQVPMVSPDGRWIAYLSDETGTNELYVASYPDLAGKRAVSSGGATEPRWSADGRELYYRSGDRMMAVHLYGGPDIDSGSGSGVNPGRPVELFHGSYLVDGTFGTPQYDVSRDGRFLMIKPHEASSGSAAVNVVFNWFEELRRLAPAAHR